MAEKTDEEIIEELSLEKSDDNSNNETLEEVSNNEQNEVLEEVTENTETNDNSSDNSSNENQEDIQTDENKVIGDIDEEEVPVQKKQPKIFRILIGVLAFLVVVLLIGLVLYFIGFFDPEEPEKTPEAKKTEMMQKEKKPESKINIKDLDKNRLNKKLQMLTKTEIMNKEELEAEERKIKEEERKKKEAEEKAIAEKKKLEEEKEAAKRAEIQKEIEQLKQHQENVKKQQEEFLRLQEEAKMELEEQRLTLLKELEEEKNKMPPEPMPVEEEMMAEEPEEVVEDEVREDIEDTKKTFLQFINVATIKGDLYKSYLEKVQMFNKNPSLCRDSKNRIEIYFGPYDSEEEREKVLTNLIENGFKESYLVDFTQEEYEKRCKY